MLCIAMLSRETSHPLTLPPPRRQCPPCVLLNSLGVCSVVIPRIEPKALCKLGKHHTKEPQGVGSKPPPWETYFIKTLFVHFEIGSYYVSQASLRTHRDPPVSWFMYRGVKVHQASACSFLYLCVFIRECRHMWRSEDDG